MGSRRRARAAALLQGVDDWAAVAEAAPAGGSPLGGGVVRELPTRPAHLRRGQMMVIVVDENAVAVRTFERPASRPPDGGQAAASVAREMAAVGALLAEAPPSSAGTGGLTKDELAVLHDSGVAVEQIASDTPADLVRQSIAAFARLIASSLTVEQAAKRLGVQSSRIRQRLGGAVPTLYGFKLKGSWYVPAIQFGRRATLPGLEQVVPALPKALHPLEVVGWLDQPHPDLITETDQGPVSPREWLGMGRPPEPVATLARDLARMP